MHAVGKYSSSVPLLMPPAVVAWHSARSLGCGLVRMLAQAVNDLLLMFLYIEVELYYYKVHIQIMNIATRDVVKSFIGKVRSPGKV